MNSNNRWATILWWLCFANAWWCSLGIYFVSRMFIVPAVVSLSVCWTLNEWLRANSLRMKARTRR